jgi:hypothetical protein
MAKKVESDRERGRKVLAKINKANVAWVGRPVDPNAERTLPDMIRDCRSDRGTVKLSRNVSGVSIKSTRANLPGQFDLFAAPAQVHATSTGIAGAHRNVAADVVEVAPQPPKDVLDVMIKVTPKEVEVLNERGHDEWLAWRAKERAWNELKRREGEMRRAMATQED